MQLFVESFFLVSTGSLRDLILHKKMRREKKKGKKEEYSSEGYESCVTGWFALFEI